MAVNNYEFIEHTADIGIIVKGKDLKDLFKNAALAMFEIIAEKKTEVKNRKSPHEAEEVRKYVVKQEADNLEELFINWLNELLSLSATKELIFSDFQISKLDKNKLEANAIGSCMKNYRMNTEIKAATYHGLEIKQNCSGCEAKIIFDV